MRKLEFTANYWNVVPPPSVPYAVGHESELAGCQGGAQALRPFRAGLALRAAFAPQSLRTEGTHRPYGPLRARLPLRGHGNALPRRCHQGENHEQPVVVQDARIQVQDARCLIYKCTVTPTGTRSARRVTRAGSRYWIHDTSYWVPGASAKWTQKTQNERPRSFVGERIALANEATDEIRPAETFAECLKPCWAD